MNFNDLFEYNENPVTELVDFEKETPVAMDLAREQTYLYRGINSVSSVIAYGDSTAGDRIIGGMTTKGEVFSYKDLLEVVPAWNKYPRRNKSYICANVEDIAEGYGRPYYVFPVGDPTIAVSPNSDFWFSFSFLEKDYNQSIRTLAANIWSFNFDIRRMQKRPKQEFLKWILSRKADFFEPTENDAGLVFRRKSMLAKLVRNHGSLLKALNVYLDPEKNNFKMIKYSNLKSISTPSEIWFEGPSYFRKVQ